MSFRLKHIDFLAQYDMGGLKAGANVAADRAFYVFPTPADLCTVLRVLEKTVPNEI